ncbi:hypothetical protein B0A54_09477 [Friedmanniomyces endolithicus]|uniref:Rhamnogalacturonase A/B/Epimerase-like pectate lyase domain-containing protein n=1 Tax=Friedmanniomyces endolithicus TaxID=329885 RepID=A0A4U0USW6_9PEZI|nr:hypothetical protein LTS09_005327 [Friedmanniomyces endolithicus]TKA38542.1 hypothetical protein B0A54_09477 [Friedmanniomyces endolithicus]
MAPSSARFSTLALFLLSFFALWLPNVRADLQIPALSPLELSVELANLDTPHLGPQIQKFHHLLDEVEAPPGTHKHEKRYGSGGSYWFSQIKRQGKVAYGANASFVIWRNVIDYGAKGDGVTDDTYAINNASADGNRCGLGCDSQTTTPAIVFFPPGTYMISAPIIQYYYTQFIGDANNLPTIKATPNFVGIGLFDSDVYLAYGYSWWTNQNNFYRQIRNFVLDITAVPPTQAQHCLHWQVAQATSLQNLVFNMVEGTLGDGNQQFGIFMDNGSGGFMEDLIFNGGGVGFFSGNQQFTVRNLTFNRCETGIFQNWNWVFLYKSITFNECGIGLDMSQGGEIPATGSIVLQDSTFNNCQYGVITTFSTNSTPSAAATLVIDNVLFTQTDPAVQYPNGTSLLTGNQRVVDWVQGWFYTAYESTIKEHNLTCWEPTADYVRTQEPLGAAPKSASLLDANGNVWERSRPQYEGVPLENFISIITVGKCAGDGITDDTQCMQNFFNSIGPNQIAYIDHGAYLVRNTVQIPNNIKIQGEIWPLFMVDGSSPIFQNMKKPVPAFRVGNPGDVGTTEIVEIVFETRGPAPGAIMIEWNLAGVTPTSTGMWDTHWRIGGSNGTLLQSDKCTKNPTVQHTSNHACIGSFLLLHVTRSGSLLMSNNWGWVSDHELDLFDHNQIDIYNGRGALIESQGPVMMYGTAFEHSMLYNYNVANAKAIYMGVIQSETMYAQDNPNSLDPFAPNSVYSDPTFAECSIIAICYKTYGLYLFNSTYIFIYGAGLYSFFNNYDQGCLLTENCQEYSVGMAQSEGIYIYALSTKAASVMVEIDQVAVVPQARSPNGFCQTVALFEYP